MAYDEVLAHRLRAVLAAEPGVTEKSMFGGRAFLLDGKLAVTASSRGGLLLRVDPAEAEDLLQPPEVTRFVMRGKDMRGWLHVTEAAIVDDAQLRRWVELGIAQARALPAP